MSEFYRQFLKGAHEDSQRARDQVRSPYRIRFIAAQLMKIPTSSHREAGDISEAVILLEELAQLKESNQ